MMIREKVKATVDFQNPLWRESCSMLPWINVFEMGFFWYMDLNSDRGPTDKEKPNEKLY